MKDLLHTADLSREDIELLLATASDFAAKPLSALPIKLWLSI
jgi:aspartate carbamoyltransferase catalytic subunit